RSAEEADEDGVPALHPQFYPQGRRLGRRRSPDHRAFDTGGQFVGDGLPVAAPHTRGKRRGGGAARHVGQHDGFRCVRPAARQGRAPGGKRLGVGGSGQQTERQQGQDEPALHRGYSFSYRKLRRRRISVFPSAGRSARSASQTGISMPGNTVPVQSHTSARNRIHRMLETQSSTPQNATKRSPSGVVLMQGAPKRST